MIGGNAGFPEESVGNTRVLKSRKKEIKKRKTEKNED